MNTVTRTAVSCLSALAIGAVGLVTPASAAPMTDTNLSCSYQLENRHHKVTGTCSGDTNFGTMSGTFNGKLTKNGTAKGSFALDSRSASWRGSFKGGGFTGAKAKGTFSVSLGTLSLSGSFIAILG
ncbi:MAG: hypothetical protein GEU86_09165 [Actinophytocola sp.]|nr:hypothetical protein [Actinophytocola sp.]